MCLFEIKVATNLPPTCHQPLKKVGTNYALIFKANLTCHQPTNLIRDFAHVARTRTRAHAPTGAHQKTENRLVGWWQVGRTQSGQGFARHQPFFKVGGRLVQVGT
jgi:hypothetical protein